jgi:hypothetical protein
MAPRRRSREGALERAVGVEPPARAEVLNVVGPDERRRQCCHGVDRAAHLLRRALASAHRRAAARGRRRSGGRPSAPFRSSGATRRRRSGPRRRSRAAGRAPPGPRLRAISSIIVSSIVGGEQVPRRDGVVLAYPVAAILRLVVDRGRPVEVEDGEVRRGTRPSGAVSATTTECSRKRPLGLDASQNATASWHTRSAVPAGPPASRDRSAVGANAAIQAPSVHGAAIAHRRTSQCPNPRERTQFADIELSTPSRGNVRNCRDYAAVREILLHD